MIGHTNAVVINGSTNFGYTVEFISDGVPYAKYIVTDGQSVVAPFTAPTKSGLHFHGWEDSEGTAIVFPYTPTSDITLTAHFVFGREGMVLTEANKLICNIGRSYYKANSGWAIAGYACVGTGSYPYTGPVLVALSAVATEITPSTGTGESFVYHGVTYYYSGGGYFIVHDQTSSNTDVVDLYKCPGRQSTIADAALTLLKRYLYEI